MIPKTAPPDIKAALKKTFAIERLRKAAQALLDENTEVAESSYRQWDFERKVWVWNDACWRISDPENAKRCIELRNALKELARCSPTTRPSESN